MDGSKKIIVLKDIPFTPDIEKIRRRLHVYASETETESVIKKYLEKSRETAKPKAIYSTGKIDKINGEHIIISSTPFQSILLKNNIENAEYLFPYLATAGKELDTIKVETENRIESDCLNLIKESALVSAVNYLQKIIKQTLNLPFLLSIDPGDFENWPRSERAQVLSLFGDNVKNIDVTLNKKHEFVPEWTRCGFLYNTEIKIESCQVCCKEPCMGRRMRFNEELARLFPDRVKDVCNIWQWKE